MVKNQIKAAPMAITALEALTAGNYAATIEGQISRINDAKTVIVDKLVKFALISQEDAHTTKLDSAASIVNNIDDYTENLEIKGESTSITLKDGYYHGVTVKIGDISPQYKLQKKSVVWSAAPQTPVKGNVYIDLDSARTATTVAPDPGQPDNFYGLEQITIPAVPAKYQDVSGCTATAQDVKNTVSFVDSKGKLTSGSMQVYEETKVIHTLDASIGSESTYTNTEYTIPEGYHNGSKVNIIVDDKTEPFSYSTSGQTVTATSGHVLGKVTINAPKLQDAPVSNITGTYDDGFKISTTTKQGWQNDITKETTFPINTAHSKINVLTADEEGHPYQDFIKIRASSTKGYTPGGNSSFEEKVLKRGNLQLTDEENKKIVKVNYPASTPGALDGVYFSENNKQNKDKIVLPDGKISALDVQRLPVGGGSLKIAYNTTEGWIKTSETPISNTIYLTDYEPNLKASNIAFDKEGNKKIFGISGSFTAEGTLVADSSGTKPKAITSGSILKGYAGFINGVQVNGGMESRGTINQTLDTATTSYKVEPGNYAGGTINVIPEDKQDNTVPSTYNPAEHFIEASSGHVLKKVTIGAVPATNLNDIVEAPMGGGYLSPSILQGKKVYADGKLVVGSMLTNNVGIKWLDIKTTTENVVEAKLNAGYYANEHTVKVDVGDIITDLQAI